MPKSSICVNSEDRPLFLTTVGYGDLSPKTPFGQFIASIVMIIGYGIIAVPTGIVTADPFMIWNKHVEPGKSRFCSRYFQGG